MGSATIKKVIIDDTIIKLLKNPSLIFNEVDERGLLHKVDGEEVTLYILRPLIKQYIISIILENSFGKLKL